MGDRVNNLYNYDAIGYSWYNLGGLNPPWDDTKATTDFLIPSVTQWPFPDVKRVIFKNDVTVKSGETVTITHDPIGNVAHIRINRPKSVEHFVDRQIAEGFPFSLQSATKNIADWIELKEKIIESMSYDQLMTGQMNWLHDSMTDRTKLPLDEYLLKDAHAQLDACKQTAEKQKLRDKVNELITLRRNELYNCKCIDCVHSTFEQLRSEILGLLE